jgi:hypothetical protein
MQTMIWMRLSIIGKLQVINMLLLVKQLLFDFQIKIINLLLLVENLLKYLQERSEQAHIRCCHDIVCIIELWFRIMIFIDQKLELEMKDMLLL